MRNRVVLCAEEHVAIEALGGIEHCRQETDKILRKHGAVEP